MPGLNPTQQDIEHFVAVTQASPADAARFLGDGATLEGALEDFFAAQAAGGLEEDDEDDLDAALAASSADANPGGPRTLSGAPADALPAGWGRPARNQFATIDGMNAQAHAAEDSDDEEPERRGNELYAGGERSGLAVQEPDRRAGGSGGDAPRGGRGLVDDILKQAREASERPQEPAAASQPSYQWGSGNTLGDDETPSVSVGGRPQRSQGRIPGAFDNEDDDDEEEDSDEEMGDEEPVERRLTFWSNGFSIEDGQLYAYDAPGSQDLLNAIKSGRAPASLWNVRFDQPVQVVVEQRTHEAYQPPAKAPMRAFEGGGNRLGSAQPEASSSSAAAPAAAPAAAAPAAVPASIQLDPSKPAASVQVRLGDGTRLVARVNLDHTVADIRGFVAASRPDPRPFVLQTTFPSRELPDSETIEQAKLANAVVVQRYT